RSDCRGRAVSVRRNFPFADPGGCCDGAQFRVCHRECASPADSPDLTLRIVRSRPCLGCALDSLPETAFASPPNNLEEDRMLRFCSLLIVALFLSAGQVLAKALASTSTSASLCMCSLSFTLFVVHPVTK